jgi:hypothetical protein
MTILQAKRIFDALSQARGVGIIEESFTVMGCEVVLRSLRPEEYEQIHAEVSDKEDIAYLNAYRLEHLARAVVEVQGVSFRGVDSVEVDVETYDEKSKRTVIETVNVETHAFIREHVLSTWGREAIDTAFRKFGDVVAKSEKASAEGVTFTIPDETPEEKLRRLLMDVKEAEALIEPHVAQNILEDLGFMHKATEEQMRGVDARLKSLTEAAEATPPPPAPAPPPERPAPPPPPAPAPEKAPQARPAPAPTPAPPPPATPEQRLQARQPLNRIPQPIPQPGRNVAPPHQARQVPPSPSPQAPAPSEEIVGGPRTRSAVIEELESAGLPGGLPPPPQSTFSRPASADEIVEVAQPDPKREGKGAMTVFERPPTGGLNPRFRPPPR